MHRAEHPGRASCGPMPWAPQNVLHQVAAQRAGVVVLDRAAPAWRAPWRRRPGWACCPSGGRAWPCWRGRCARRRPSSAGRSRPRAAGRGSRRGSRPRGRPRRGDAERRRSAWCTGLPSVRRAVDETKPFRFIERRTTTRPGEIHSHWSSEFWPSRRPRAAPAQGARRRRRVRSARAAAGVGGLGSARRGRRDRGVRAASRASGVLRLLRGLGGGLRLLRLRRRPAPAVWSWSLSWSSSVEDLSSRPTTCPTVVPVPSSPPRKDEIGLPVTASMAVIAGQRGDHHGEAGEHDLAPREVPGRRESASPAAGRVRLAPRCRAVRRWLVVRDRPTVAGLGAVASRNGPGATERGSVPGDQGALPDHARRCAYDVAGAPQRPGVDRGADRGDHAAEGGADEGARRTRPRGEERRPTSRPERCR